MVTLKIKGEGKKNFKLVKTFRNYDFAWRYVSKKLMRLDYRLYLSCSMQYLCDGYTKKRVFPYATTSIKRKGVEYKIII